MKSSLAPIVLFVYNRPWHTRQTLDALSKNILADESKLYIYADGPKENATEEQLQKIKEVRILIREKKWCKEVEVIEWEKNMGIEKSTITGVTEIVNKYGKIVVLEDDIVTSVGFLKYMNEALSLYEKEETVMHISGYMFPVKEKLSETFFLPLISSWGWATWARAWKEVHSTGQQLKEKISANKLTRNFNLGNSIDYYSMFTKQLDGSIGTWDIIWYASVFLKNGLGLWPGKSLVQNIGHDGSGIHCPKTNFYDIYDLANEIRVEKIEIVANELAYKNVIKYFKKSLSPSFLSRIISRITMIVERIRDWFFFKENKTKNEHHTDIYWDPKMAEALETWGKDHVWNEIQMFLFNYQGRVLDIACGTGITMEILSKYKSLELYGVDISDFLINKSNERGIDKKYLQVCDVTNMSIYKDNFFDYSYSIGSLEHFTEDGLLNAISEIHRITKNISFHQMPVSRIGKDEGWITPYQSYYNNSEQWWIEKFKKKFTVVHVINSGWNDNQSFGRWFVCIK